MSQDSELVREYRLDPKKFIRDMWGLIPQPIKPEHEDDVYSAIVSGDFNSIQAIWFQPFEKGKHITWQQFLILSAVEKAAKGQATHRISVRSGHGIGKSAVISWLLLWYLFCYQNSQIPCTAPSSDQMYDVLWKEAALWIYRMPKAVADLYEHQSTHIRMKQSPETWFARAKTARKEAPEALAGIHSDNVMMLVDEASGVPEQIYVVAEGALTSADIFVILISNPTRLVGYFHDTHAVDSHNWQIMRFNSEDSPIVDDKYVNRIIEKYGIGSDEYRVRVLGEFPKADAIDSKGYTPMYTENDIIEIPETHTFLHGAKMGIDPAGEGDDKTVWVVRDTMKAAVVAVENISSPKSIAQKTLTLMDMYKILPNNIYVDNFGVGANVAQELARAYTGVLEGRPKIQVMVNGINVGDKADDPDTFVNKKAEAFRRGKEWIRSGGEFVEHNSWKELLTIRYRAELSGKTKIMSKKEMKDEGYLSPNTADAWMLTFVDDMYTTQSMIDQQNIESTTIREEDKYDIFTM